MKSPMMKNCPSCGRKLQQIPDNRANFVVECDSCGFIASIRDIARADYLANVSEFPDIRVTALRIATRTPLSAVRPCLLDSRSASKVESSYDER